MEHRWYPRRELFRTALLYYRGDLLCAGRIANVSCDGLLVRTPAIELPRDSCVDVVSADGRSEAESPHCTARVVHGGEGGWGLMCMGVNPFAPD